MGYESCAVQQSGSASKLALRYATTLRQRENNAVCVLHQYTHGASHADPSVVRLTQATTIHGESTVHATYAAIRDPPSCTYIGHPELMLRRPFEKVRKYTGSRNKHLPIPIFPANRRRQHNPLVSTLLYGTGTFTNAETDAQTSSCASALLQNGRDVIRITDVYISCRFSWEHELWSSTFQKKRKKKPYATRLALCRQQPHKLHRTRNRAPLFHRWQNLTLK